MENANNRMKLSALAAIAIVALFGLPVCFSSEQDLDDDVDTPSETAPIQSLEQGLDEDINTPYSVAPFQVCVGGGTCGDGYHCCGDGTRDWCCPQTSGCGPSYPNDACR